jgi:AcrR family transcriptional regulator
MTEETTARPATRRGPYAKSAQRRAEIVASATAVFAARGYRGGSLREIAKQLDLSLTSVVHHFPSKSDLLVAVLESADSAHEESFQADSRQHGVAHAVLQYVRRNVDRPEMLRLLALMAAESSAPDHPAHEWFRRRYDETIGRLTIGLHRDQNEGRVSNTRDPHGLAESVVALWDGLQLQWLIDPNRDIVTAMTAALNDLLGPPALPEAQSR